MATEKRKTVSVSPGASASGRGHRRFEGGLAGRINVPPGGAARAMPLTARTARTAGVPQEPLPRRSTIFTRTVRLAWVGRPTRSHFIVTSVTVVWLRPGTGQTALAAL